MKRYRHSVWMLATVLSGCLASQEPLIGDADSVAPLADGAYTYAGDGFEGEAVVSHSGGVTRIVSDDEAPEGSEVRMAKLRRGYYIVMSQEDDDEYLYGLMRVQRRRFTFYRTEGNCERLQELWLVGGKTPADVGIASIEGSPFATCLFKRYEDLERASHALLGDGRLEPSMVFVRR